MKEFEKWWNKRMSRLNTKNTCMSHIGYPEASEAWKAALEWVLKDVYRCQYGMGMDNLAQQIREELLGE